MWSINYFIYIIKAYVYKVAEQHAFLKYFSPVEGVLCA